MSDRISLVGLRVLGRHGVFEHEQRDGQEFVVDVEASTDLARAGETDQLADTIDYGALASRVAEIVAGPPHNLIESLAARIADVLIADERMFHVEVTVHKPQAPMPVSVADVAVTIVRTRSR